MEVKVGSNKELSIAANVPHLTSGYSAEAALRAGRNAEEAASNVEKCMI